MILPNPKRYIWASIVSILAIANKKRFYKKEK